jgi:hypothetical protein
LFVHANGSTSVPAPSSIPEFKTIKEYKMNLIGMKQNLGARKHVMEDPKKKLTIFLAFQVDIGGGINSFERSFTDLWGSSSVG